MAPPSEKAPHPWPLPGAPEPELSALRGGWFSFHTLGVAERLEKVRHLCKVRQPGGEEAGSALRSA